MIRLAQAVEALGIHDTIVARNTVIANSMARFLHAWVSGHNPLLVVIDFIMNPGTL